MRLGYSHLRQADAMEEVWRYLKEGQNDCTAHYIAQEDIPTKLAAGECHKRNQEIRRSLAKRRA